MIDGYTCSYLQPMDYIRYFEEQQIKDTQRPQLQPGDIVRVAMQIKEGSKTRVQTFEGTVLSIRGSGPSATFTVRREVTGFGVERIFPLYSPLISSIEITRRQKVRRAKLTYLRQAGRRRFKEDVAAMQRHIRAEEHKKRLAALRQAQDQERAAQEEAEQKKQEETTGEDSAQAPETTTASE